jgi:GNAT superfamily N-acetyltransferase
MNTAVTEALVVRLEQNLWDMWSLFGRGEGCTLVDTPAMMRFETPIPFVPYNSVMRFRVDERVDETIDEVLDAYAERAVPLMWVVHPRSQPADLDARLERRGLVEAEVCPGMIAELSAVPKPDSFPDGVHVEQLVSSNRAEFVELVAWRYSLPPDATAPLLSIMEAGGVGRAHCATQAWFARVDGTVVSKVVLHLAAGVAGLYGVATRPEARGLGLARNLTALALDQARHLGYRIGVLHSSPMAVGLYARLGFRPIADFRLYSTPDTLHL